MLGNTSDDVTMSWALAFRALRLRAVVLGVHPVENEAFDLLLLWALRLPSKVDARDRKRMGYEPATDSA